MPKIKFLREEQYECDGRNLGPVFTKGEEILATEEFAQRWVRRLAADVVGRGEPKKGDLFTRVEAPVEVKAASTPPAGSGSTASISGATGSSGGDTPTS